MGESRIPNLSVKRGSHRLCGSPPLCPTLSNMKIIKLLFASFLGTLAILLRPGGTKAILAENRFLKLQLLILTRPRPREPNLSFTHRVLMGFGSLFLKPQRMAKSAISITPSTLLKFHRRPSTGISQGSPNSKSDGARLYTLGEILSSLHAGCLRGIIRNSEPTGERRISCHTMRVY